MSQSYPLQATGRSNKGPNYGDGTSVPRATDPAASNVSCPSRPTGSRLRSTFFMSPYRDAASFSALFLGA